MNPTDAQSVPRRAFISHSSADSASAQALAAALEAEGVPCWIAPRDIAPGLRYGEALIGGINACTLFVLLLSERSNASPQVLAEVERAVSKGIPVLTIRLASVSLAPSLEYFLSSFHWIDAFPGEFEGHLDRLAEAVRRSMGASPPVPSLPSPAGVAAPEPPRETPNNLPRQLSSFIGRETEIAQITAQLGQAPLLTLLGGGGTGKTRLSLEVARGVTGGFPDGLWFVELAPLSDPGLVTQAVADALSVREEPGASLPKILCAHLKDKRLLLILDNCEHVLASAATLAADILRACPGVTVLASSREPLSVPGEVCYRVSPLSLPGDGIDATATEVEGCEAVRLFLARAQAAKPGFALTDANAPAVAAVCRRLDGIPLALELAAARVKMLSVEEVNARLDNRFRLLTGGSKTLLPRQQTLRALIDWSYDLLSEQEKTLLTRLSVFAGGWTLAASETVCAGDDLDDWEVLDVLTALVDKSLVVPYESGGVGRYRLLETVRQYAGERLAEGGGAEAARARHRDCFAALAAEAHLVGPDQSLWLPRLDSEYDNLREALGWCEREASDALTAAVGEAWLALCCALGWFWEVRGIYGEGLDWLDRALVGTDGVSPPGARGRALGWRGRLLWRQGEYGPARSALEASLLLSRSAGDDATIAFALNILGSIAQNQGEYVSARVLYEESLGIRRRMGDQRGIAAALGSLGGIAVNQGDYVSARALYEESLGICRRMGDQRGIAYALGNLGSIAQNQGEYVSARVLYEESLGIRRRMGDQRGIAAALGSLGGIAVNQGESGSARALLGESLGICRRMGDQRGIAIALNNLGVIAQNQGEYVSARALFEESLGIRRRIGNQYGIAEALVEMSCLACVEGDFASARACLAESLALSHQIGAQAVTARALGGAARLAVLAGDGARAARLLGASAALRAVIGAVSETSDRLNEVESSARVLMGDDAAFAAAYASGSALSVDAAVAEALRA